MVAEHRSDHGTRRRNDARRSILARFRSIASRVMTNPNVDPTIEGLTPLRGRDTGAPHHRPLCLHEARAGHGSVVLVEGRRGFGKSRLLHEARAAANAAGFRVGAGTAVHGDVALSMSVLQSALSDGATPIVDRSYLAAAASRIDPDGVVERLLAPLEQAARSAPVLVCIDDAQWVDGGTAAALRLLARRLEHLPIVWVVAFHTRSSSPLLMDLVAHLDGVGAELVALDALDDAAIAQVVSDVLQAQPTPALLQLAGCSEGSPVLLVELIRGARRRRTRSGGVGTRRACRGSACRAASATSCAPSSHTCPDREADLRGSRRSSGRRSRSIMSHRCSTSRRPRSSARSRSWCDAELLVLRRLRAGVPQRSPCGSR